MKGIIIKAYGGFYFVHTDAGLIKCKIRGRIALQHKNVLVGDRVQVHRTGPGEGVIENILPRTTELQRPAVANVDQTVIVLSWVQPRPNAMLLDRFLLQSLVAQIPPVICFNKTELAAPGDLELARDYQPTGFPVLSVSANTGLGLQELKAHLQNRVSVLAGPSGVGKSSLLNSIQPGLGLKTGTISHKLKRGRHTTRHVELIPLTGGGLVADTPGFTSLQLPSMRREELAGYYPEFAPHASRCRFNGCLHHHEPGCAVKEAVQKGLVSRLRHENYLVLLVEVMEMERRY